MSKISAPGVYDISIEAYHNTECCIAPSISGSGLVKLSPPEGVPAKFWWESTMNPHREPADTVALRIGKCAHTLFLEGIDAVQAGFVIDNLPRTGEGSKKAMEAFKADAKAMGKVIIRAEGNETQLGWDDIQAMIKAIDRYPLVRAAFSDGKAERTIVWKDEETGVWCRCRPDWLPNDVTHIPQYKTALSAAQWAFSNAISGYGYHIKAAHEMAGIRAVGLGEPKTYTHYVQEKDKPYLMAIHTLPRETLEYAEVQRRTALRTFADCLSTGKWPGYPEHAQETGLPVHALRRLENADLSGTTQQEKTNEPSRFTRADTLLAG